MKLERVLLSTILIIIIFTGAVFAADRVSLGFIYGASDSIELVDRTNGAINQVSPTCLNLDKKGNLVVTSDLTHEFVEAMHERNIIVTPFLSNHWVRSKGQSAIKNAENLTNQILSVINEYNLDGINVDIENLTKNDRDLLTEFVRCLREKLPENKLLTVSVAANPEESDSGWQGSYDYEKLGTYADYLFVMTYDEHSQGGAEGPVASLNFTEKSIEYALKYVSKDKIVLGIPLYGRYWRNGADVGGEAIVIGAVPNIISKNKANVSYDETIGEAKVTFNVSNSNTKINGKTLEQGTYTIWYANDKSIKAKLDLVNKYDLLGAGVWALGQENVSTWEEYKAELNKVPYISVEERIEMERQEKIEQEKIEMQRKKYEALVIIAKEVENNKKYIDRMKTINIDNFDKIIEDEKIKTKIEEPHIHEEFVRDTSYKPTEVTLDKNLMDDKKKVSKRQTLNSILSKLKTIHRYRLCKKNH